MNTPRDTHSLKIFEYEHELERHLVDHFDDILAATGLELLLVGQQPRLPSRRADLLALDESGTPVLIELKIGAAAPDAVTQLLRYAHAVSAFTEDDFLALPNSTGNTASLAERFETKFGRSFTINLGEAPGMVVIAKSFTPDTAQVLAALHDHGTRVRALRYVTGRLGCGLQIDPVGRDELARIALENPNPQIGSFYKVGASGDTVVAASDATDYRVHIHDDVQQFWDEFNVTYRDPIAPIKLITDRFEEWRAGQTTGVLPALSLERQNMMLLAREIKTLAEQDAEWVRFYYRQDCPVLSAANPTARLEVRLRRGYPYTRAAYARQDMFERHVALVV